MTPLELLQQRRRHLERLANQSGARGEPEAILLQSNWMKRPRGPALQNLLALLNEQGISIRGSSFDAIVIPSSVTLDFNDRSQLRAVLQQLIFVEIKTASQSRVRDDFSGFFFALTSAEIEAAEALGNRHRVLLYNRLTRQSLLTSVPEIMRRSRSHNWQVSVQL